MAVRTTAGQELPALDTLRSGDARAWEAFFGYFGPTIRAIVAWPRWHFDAHTAEDVAQTIRLGIVQSLNRLHSEEALPAFVKRICVNRCIDMLRRQLREQNRLLPLGRLTDEGEWEEVDVPADAACEPVALLQREERAALLREALARLDEPSRECLTQFYVQGLSYREMAERQGVAVNTVGSRLSRCLDRLRALLARSEAAPESTG